MSRPTAAWFYQTEVRETNLWCLVTNLCIMDKDDLGWHGEICLEIWGCFLPKQQKKNWWNWLIFDGEILNFRTSDIVNNYESENSNAPANFEMSLNHQDQGVWRSGWHPRIQELKDFILRPFPWILLLYFGNRTLKTLTDIKISTWNRLKFFARQSIKTLYE